MSKNITGPRVLGGFKPESMQTAEGRTAHLEALCAAAKRAFEAQGKVNLLSWIWVQQNPHGEPTPAILAVELVSEIDAERHDAFEARVVKACELGKALAVATVSGHQSIQLLFESYAGSELLSASIRSSADPLDPSTVRRSVDPFAAVSVDRAPERFMRCLHEPLGASHTLK